MNISQKKALTLTELIVVSLLIGIVMIGIVSFSASMKQMQVSTNRETILAMQTTAAMTHITTNAALAIGFSGDPGIFTNNSATREWISFRQDRNQTPDDYMDDTWTIYFIRKLPAPNRFYYCEKPIHQV